MNIANPCFAAHSCTPVDELVARRLGLVLPLSRDDLERAQMALLRQTLVHATAFSQFYRERFANVDIASCQNLADLDQIPLLTGQDLSRDGSRLLCVSQSQVARIVSLTTSGSTGKPKRLHFTHQDLAATTDFFLSGMRSLVASGDRVLVLLPFSQPDSVGDLLIRALRAGGIVCRGLWPPLAGAEMVTLVNSWAADCLVGLPAHLLAIAEGGRLSGLRSMLLCSDYAAPALRQRIETACGCQTFLHYGMTETGLGGGVECSVHQGCHLRESDLLVEIIDPGSGSRLGPGQSGEVVITTLARQGMPLIRYRTGDRASLETTVCACGGVTSRLTHICGRLAGSILSGGILNSYQLDDFLFQIPGLFDYRLRLDRGEVDRLHIDYLAASETSPSDKEICRTLLEVPVILRSLVKHKLILGEIKQVEAFPPDHTVKRTIIDQR